MNRFGWLIAVTAAVVSFAAGAMPSRMDLKKVSPTVNELMAGDMKAVKAGELKQVDAASHAVEYAREATDEASKFLFYKGAFGLYVKGRAYGDALRVLDLLRQEVKDVPDKVLLEIIGGKLKDVPRENGGALISLYDELDRKLRYQGDCTRLEGVLKGNPKDAESRRLLAVRRAQLGDWAEALKNFAQLEGAEAKAAKAEQAGDLKAAADGWWDLAANAEEDEQALIRRHAADLYRQAVAQGKVQGIQKSLAQKRADEYPAEGTAIPAVAKAEPQAPKKTEEKPEERPNREAKAIARPPAHNGKGITLKLKKGERLEFVQCPAGSFTAGLCWPQIGNDDPRARRYKVTISRPFYMTRTPVTLGQYFVGGQGAPLPKDDLGKFGFRSLVDGTAAVRFSEKFLSPDDVEDWCRELTKRYKGELPKGYVVRLPTEAEFEYAARAGSDDVDDLFVKPYPSEAEKDALRVSKAKNIEILRKNGQEIDARGICKSAPWLGNVLMGGGFPAPVAQCRPNAWGIYDVWGYLTDVLLADRGVQGKQNAYWFLPKPVDCPDGAVDPIKVAPAGQLAGNYVLQTSMAAAAYDGGRERAEYRGRRLLTLRKVAPNAPVGRGFIGARSGFFLVIAPDVSSLTPIR